MCRMLVLAAFIVIPAGAAAQLEAPSHVFVPSGEDSVWVGIYEPPAGAALTPALVLVPGFPAIGADVLGLGQSLSKLGSYVLVLHPRGHGSSSGWATFANAKDDVGAVLEWLETTDALPESVPRPVVLGGYSWGGGIVLSYAAEHPATRRVVSIAASDHGAFIRRVDEDRAYGDFFRSTLESLEAPNGPVRFDVDADLAELRSDWESHDLSTIAPRLAGRDLLLIVGWDDEQVEVEHQVLPFYRALRAAEAETLRIIGYQDDHSFESVRSRMTEAIHAWLEGQQVP